MNICQSILDHWLKFTTNTTKIASTIIYQPARLKETETTTTENPSVLPPVLQPDWQDTHLPGKQPQPEQDEIMLTRSSPEGFTRFWKAATTKQNLLKGDEGCWEDAEWVHVNEAV